jgi:hypothetical protein
MIQPPLQSTLFQPAKIRGVDTRQSRVQQTIAAREARPEGSDLLHVFVAYSHRDGLMKLF